MSIKVNNWVWQDSPREIDDLPFNGNPFIVLQALADIADDDGNVIYAAAAERTQEALAWKARVSLRTFQRALVLLTEAGLVTVTLTGRENSYKINMTAVEEENTRQSDVFIISAAKDDTLSTHATSGGSGTPTVADHKDVLTEDLKNQSGLEVTTVASALRADGDVSQPRLGIADRLRSAGARRHLNILELNDRLEQYFDDVAGHENVRRVVYLVAKRILAKAAYAKTDLVDPTRYVITAVVAEPEVWRKYAFSLDPRS